VVAVERDAKRAVNWAGRVGMVCYGVVHLLIGWLAAQVAFGDRGRQANQKGAVQTVAAQPLGEVLLWILAIGLAAFGVWQLWVGARGYRWVGDKGKRTRKRIGSAARGLVALLVSGYALRLLLSEGGSGSGAGSGGSGSGESEQKELTARVLELPAGRVLVGATALVLIGIGISRILKGVRTKFVNNLDFSQLPPEARRPTIRLGQVGYPAKGLAIGIIGVLLGLAAVHRDPNQAGGLDAALRTLAAQPFGTILLIVVAVGFAAYGVYCFAAARAQRS
jgi:hypothetical protein